MSIDFRPATQSDFEHLYSLGTDGSVPGEHALRNQVELFARREGAPSVVVYNGVVIGVVTMVGTPYRDALTTVTYIAPNYHNTELSGLLKGTALIVARSFNREYVIFVSPSNPIAMASMAAIWPDAGVEVTDDGTLAYIPPPTARVSVDLGLAAQFSRILS